MMKLNSSLPSITVVLTVINEAHNLKNCVQAAQNLSNDIIVVDTGSTDKTIEIAKAMGLQVYEFPFAHIVEPARNFAISKALGDWVFILDADERISPQFADEILTILPHTKHSYFQNPRKNIFAFQKALLHGGWYPDLVTRLIKKSALQDWPSTIHSKPIIKGSCGILSHSLLHFFHTDLESMLTKTINYENKVANLLFEARRPVTTLTFIRKFLGETYKRFFKKSGYRDGIYGFVENFYQAFSQTITWIFLWEKYQNEKTSYH